MEHGVWSGSTADVGAHVCCRQKPWAGGSNSFGPDTSPQESRHARGEHSNGRKQLLLKIIPRRVHKTPLHIDHATTQNKFSRSNMARPIA